MSKKLVLTAVIFFLAGCGGEGPGAASAHESGDPSTSSSAANQARPGKSKDTKWAVAIEGLPDKSGKVISAVTMGNSGRYGLADSDFTATVGIDEDSPSGHMMFTYHDADTRCLNRGDATAIADGERAVISGQVMCMPKSGGDESSAAINGWFELDQ